MISIQELLGRDALTVLSDKTRAGLKGRVVLVTGAGGSIGSEICRQLASCDLRAIIGLDHAEPALYAINKELANAGFIPEIGSIQNQSRLDQVFEKHRPNIVYHAAAYKHVPMMENHVLEAMRNNVIGTASVAAAAKHVERFVLISTDKAVRPTSVMGATKRLAEMITERHGERFTVVRFGNVLGSSGSVVPLFQEQIAKGVPLTVTHPDMERYFMTIPEAAQLVMEAGLMGKGTFVLDMGAPVRIVDIARKMAPAPYPIKFSGLRPGEKLQEELITDNSSATSHPKIRLLSPERNQLDMAAVRSAVQRGDAGEAVLVLKESVPDYNPSAALLRRTFNLEHEPSRWRRIWRALKSEPVMVKA